MTRNGPRPTPTDADALYLELLDAFYEREDGERAREVARRLEPLLTSDPGLGESIRGDEIRSLLAELGGDVPAAIRWREREIRKILELHSVSVNTPAWEYVYGQYDHGDVADRLELLAILHEANDDLDQAVATLLESKAFCAGHGIPFDGQDVLDEYEQRLAAAR